MENPKDNDKLKTNLKKSGNILQCFLYGIGWSLMMVLIAAIFLPVFGIIVGFLYFIVMMIGG